MSHQRITIELPDAIFRQLEQTARATQQPLESLVAQSVISNLPPTIENAPPELQVELLHLQTLDLDALLAVAQAEIDPNQYQQHLALLERNATGQLTPAEQAQLSHLRLTSDQLMLRKAYAWSLLRWRGYRLPALSDLAIPV